METLCRSCCQWSGGFKQCVGLSGSLCALVEWGRDSFCLRGAATTQEVLRVTQFLPEVHTGAVTVTMVEINTNEVRTRMEGKGAGGTLGWMAQ